MIKTLIVDDEFQGRSFLEKVIAKLFPGLSIVGKAATVNEALDIIETHQPQLIFLDVMLNNENGFDLLERLDKINFEIIFTTAHNEFAVKAFKFNALDYLLKPIDLDELEKAIDKAKKKVQLPASPSLEVFKNFIDTFKNPSNPLNKLSIPTADGFMLIPLNEIIFCESFGNYTTFHLVNNKKITSSYTLKEYDELLSDQNFFRAHKSHLVNLAHISRYVKGEGGTLMMSNGYEIEVSRRNKEALLKILKS